MMKQLSILFFMAALLAWWHQSFAAPKEQSLAAGHAIRVQSSTEPSLNGTFALDWNGRLTVPPCETFNASGLTPTELEDLLGRCLLKFLKPPLNLSLSIVEPRLFAVQIGWRQETPVTVHTAARSTPNSVLAQAGMSPSYDTILRLISPFGLDLVLPASNLTWSKAFDWRGGERMILEKPHNEKSDFTIDVLGEVKKPGRFGYHPSRSVLAVIRDAHGLTTTADPAAVVLIRNANGNKLLTTWDDQHTKVEPGDVVYIPAREEGLFEKGLRWTGSILAVINTVFLIFLAI